MNKYCVYKIIINGEVKYIGRTNNIKRREYQHNYNLRKGKEGLLYNHIRDLGIDKIELIVIDTFKKKVDSKRYEMYILLNDYFDEYNYKYQKIPNISDR